MSEVKWLIEKTTFKENIDLFVDKVEKLNIEYKFIKYFDFISKNKDEIYKEYFEENSCVVFYGSLQLAQEINKLKYYPGVFCSLKNYECFNYYPKFSKFLLNSEYVMLPFGDLLNKKNFLYKILGNNDCLFIRPSNGFKTFTGFVIEKENYEKDLDSINYHNLNDNKLVVISEPRNIFQEYRFIISENKILSYSQYKENNNIKISSNVEEDVIFYVEKILNEVKWQPDKIFSLDVVRLKNGEIKMLEIGCFSCSGLYSCDCEKIIKNVSKIALETFKDVKDV